MWYVWFIHHCDYLFGLTDFPFFVLTATAHAWESPRGETLPFYVWFLYNSQFVIQNMKCVYRHCYRYCIEYCTPQCREKKVPRQSSTYITFWLLQMWGCIVWEIPLFFSIISTWKGEHDRHTVHNSSHSDNDHLRAAKQHELNGLRLSHQTWKVRATVSKIQAPQQIPNPQRSRSRRPEASTMKT